MNIANEMNIQMKFFIGRKSKNFFDFFLYTSMSVIPVIKWSLSNFHPSCWPYKWPKFQNTRLKIPSKLVSFHQIR